MPRKVEAAPRTHSLADLRVHEQSAAMAKAREEAKRLLEKADVSDTNRQSLRNIVDTLAEGRVRSHRRVRKMSKGKKRSGSAAKK